MGYLSGYLWQGFIVVGTGSVRIKHQVELILPTEFEAGFGHGVVADLRARMPLGQIGGVGGDLICD